MRRRNFLILSAVVVLSGVTVALRGPRDIVDERTMATGQHLSPAGLVVPLTSRVVDVIAKDGKMWLKESERLEVFSTDGKLISTINSKDGASQTGLLTSPLGVLFSDAKETVHEFGLIDGKLKLIRDFALPKGAYPNGMAWLEKDRSFLVCLSLLNKVVVVDYLTGNVVQSWDTDAAPYQVVVAEGRMFVSCQGGRVASRDVRSSKSAGTDVPVDESGHTAVGVVDAIDLYSKQRETIDVGLQPGALHYLEGSKQLAVACANDDSIEFIDVKKLTKTSRFVTTIDPRLPFGSMPNGFAESPDGQTLYVSLAGNNAVEAIDITKISEPKAKGFIPTNWYPGALAFDRDRLGIISVKGIGSRKTKSMPEKGRNSWDATGSLQLVTSTELGKLDVLSDIAKRGARAREIYLANVPGRASATAVPVPIRVGEPSVFNHVIYVIKENRTYDQVFGDIATGDGDPKLCVFPEKVTPNQHALAREFALLDNYYCNGVCSADGHAWAIEGNVTPYLEHEFGGFGRSYDYGTDPITYSKSGFIWDHVLAKGKSFRNFGELDLASLPDNWKLTDVWRNYTGSAATFGQRLDIERLRRYSCREYPGWEMGIPDGLRMERFLKEFRDWEKQGTMPNFLIVYLPQDHTAGTSPGYPTPASYVADNDFAVGKLVDALSHSQFWKDSVVFVNEDDPQNGYDHVDGHRSTCLAISPYTKRKETVSAFYNQDSVVHTILRIFSCPAMNQTVAMAPLMSQCFSATPNLSPFSAIDPDIDRSKLNPAVASLTGDARKWAMASAAQNFSHPDYSTASSDDSMNRAVWFAMKGMAPYPSQYAGAHGKGLKQKGLRHDGAVDDEG